MASEEPKDKKPEPTDEKTKLLNLMRFWLFGTFVIVWAATFAYLAIFTGSQIGIVLKSGWPIWVITLALCILAYVIYTIYLNRKYE